MDDSDENAEQANTEEVLQKLEEQKTLLAELEAAGDPEKCDQLEDQGFKIQCESNILLKLAGENKDPSYCEDIEKAFKEDCILVATELDPPDFIDMSQPLPQ